MDDGEVMEYRPGADISGGNVRYGGGGGGGTGRGSGGRIAVGGGVGGLIVLLIALFFGGNVGDLISGGAPQQDTNISTADQPQCQVAGDIAKDRDCRWKAYMAALNGYWSTQFSKGFRTPASMELFSGRISTACGTGSSEMGPFYCPGDEIIYVDDQFVGQLLRQLGTEQSDPAELYIVAHEYGHHISNLTGQMSQARQSGNDTGPKSSSVRLELQADCYAGVFLSNTIKDPNSPIQSVTQNDLDRIVEAARAVGDDHIQEQSGGRVVPESWTHGSSRMRQYWVATGFRSGQPSSCDTFSTDQLGG